MQYLKQSTTATVIVGPFVDITDGVTPETALTTGGVDEIGLYKHDGTALVDISGTTAFTPRAGGMYTATLSAVDTGTAGRLRLYVRDDSEALPVWEDFMVISANEFESLVTGTAPNVNVATIAVNAINAAALASNCITSAKINTGAITDGKLAGDCITAAKIANGAIDANAIADDAITADKFGPDAITAANLAPTAVNEIVDQVWDEVRGQHTDVGSFGEGVEKVIGSVTIAVASGTADSGSITTLVDAALTQDESHWNGAWLVITNGTLAGQARKILSFAASSNTITVDRDFTAAVATHTYEIWPADFPNYMANTKIETDGRVHADVKEWSGVGATVGSSNLPEVDAKAISDSLTAADNLQLSANQIIPGTVATSAYTPTTTEFEADDIAEATAEHYKGRIIIFTSGDLAGQASDITAYARAGSNGHFTVTALTEAPANDATFVIV